jgi:hypothetical protein
MKSKINLLIISFLLSSCSINKPLVSSVQPSDIQEFGLLKPNGNITVLMNQDETTFNQGLTNEINAKSLYDLQQIFRWNNLKYSLIELEPEVQNEVDLEIYKIVNQINKIGTSAVDNTFSNRRANFAFQHLEISDELADIITQRGKRFAVSVLNFGFVRTPSNKQKSNLENVGYVAGGVALAALTGVGAFVVNKPYNLNSYAIVIDAEKKRLAYFQFKNFDKDPTNDENLKEQLHQLFDGYWLEYDSQSGRYQKMDK